MTPDEIRALADKMESMASFVARVLGHSVDAHDCRRAAAALRELVEDQERLHWLGTLTSALHTGDSGYAMPVESDGRWYIYSNNDALDVESDTLRAAIDAAMRAERGEGNG